MPTPPFARAARATRSVEEHRAAVAELLAPLPVEQVPLGRARGRVLAEALVAGIALPPFDNSAMDGYAVRATDVAGATDDDPRELPVTADIPAGRTDVPPLEPGTAHRIMTGAPLPAGADTVVQVEHTDGGTGPGAHPPSARGRARRSAGRGRTSSRGRSSCPRAPCWARRRSASRRRSARRRLPVRRRPTVLVLSTGSELVAPGTPLQLGQIYESNGPMLAAAVEDAGGVAELLRFVPDDVEHLHRVLDDRLAVGTVDLVLTSGGVSAGAYEVVKDASRAGASSSSRSPCSRAGRRAWGGSAASGSSRCPATRSARTCRSRCSCARLLRAALGHPHPERPRVTASLAAPLTSTAGRRQFRRGVVDAVAGTVAGGRRPAVAPARSAGAGRLLLRRARGGHGTACRRAGRGVAARGCDVTGITSGFCNDLGAGSV